MTVSVQAGRRGGAGMPLEGKAASARTGPLCTHPGPGAPQPAVPEPVIGICVNRLKGKVKARYLTSLRKRTVCI